MRKAEQMINNEEASRQFDKRMVEKLDAITYKMLADGGGVQLSLLNWGVPAASSEKEVQAILTR